MSNSPNPELCRELVRRLAALEADRARVLRHISHELKTPLAALREGVALLQEEVVGPLSIEQREVVGILKSNALLLEQQIEDLLKYHAASLEAASLRPITVSLREIFFSLIEERRLPLLARQLRTRIDCKIDQVQLDPEKLRAALANLLSNAIAFSPEGGEIRLRAGVSGGLLSIDCLDDGPGVAAADAVRIFEPFVQGVRRPLSREKGSGVGLSIVSELVAALGGRVSLVASERGAHFRMELPYEA